MSEFLSKVLDTSSTIGSSAYKNYDKSKKLEEGNENYRKTKSDFTDNFINNNMSPFLKETLGGVSTPSKEEYYKRSTIDRIFGMLGNGSIVEGMYNLTDGDDSTTFGQGFRDGLHYMNPFTDDVRDRNTFSDVLKNIGWEDKNPDKLELSDVGRGVVGFVGDVALDPISYINPFSATAKVVKGTGVTAKQMKQLSKVSAVGKQIGKVNNPIANLKYVPGISQSDAERTIRQFYERKASAVDGDGVIISAKMPTDKEITREAENLRKSVNQKMLKLAEGGQDFSIGFGKFKASLIGADTLRNLGDKTIAPYYNSLAKKIRTSKFGQKLTKYGDLEKLYETDPTEAIGVIHAENLLSGKHIPHMLNLARIHKETDIEEYIKSLSEKEQMELFRAYETGELVRAADYFFAKEEIIKKIKTSKTNYNAKVMQDHLDKSKDKVLKPLKDKIDGYEKEMANILTVMNNTINKLDGESFFKGKGGTKAFTDAINESLGMHSKLGNNSYIDNVDEHKAMGATDEQLAHINILKFMENVFGFEFRGVNKVSFKHNIDGSKQRIDELGNIVHSFNPNFKMPDADGIKGVGGTGSYYNVKRMPSVKNVSKPGPNYDLASSISDLFGESSGVTKDMVTKSLNLIFDEDHLFEHFAHLPHVKKYYATSPEMMLNMLDDPRSPVYKELEESVHSLTHMFTQTDGKALANSVLEFFDSRPLKTRKSDARSYNEEQFAEFLKNNKDVLKYTNKGKANVKAVYEEAKEAFPDLFKQFESIDSVDNVSMIEQIATVIKAAKSGSLDVDNLFDSQLNKIADDNVKKIINKVREHFVNKANARPLDSIHDAVNKIASKFKSDLDLYDGYENDLIRAYDAVIAGDFESAGKEAQRIAINIRTGSPKLLDSMLKSPDPAKALTESKWRILTDLFEEFYKIGGSPTNASDDIIKTTRLKAQARVMKPEHYVQQFNSLPDEVKEFATAFYKAINLEEMVNNTAKYTRQELAKLAKSTTGEESSFYKLAHQYKLLDEYKTARQAGASPAIAGKTYASVDDFTDEVKKLKTDYAKLEKDVLDGKHIDQDALNNDLIKVFAYEKEIDKELKKMFNVTFKSLARIEKFAGDEKVMKFYKIFSSRMDEIALEEIRVGKLTYEQYESLKGIYIPHMLTDEARNAMFEILEDDNGKFMPKIIGLQKTFDRARKEHTVTKAAEALKKHPEYAASLADIPVERIFKTCLSEIYLQRSIYSNKLVFREDVYNHILNNLCKRYNKGVGQLDDHVIITYDELMAALKHNGMQLENFCKKLGLDYRTIGYNTPFISLNAEQRDALVDALSTLKDGQLVLKYGTVIPSMYNVSNHIMERVNVLSRTQQQMLQSDMLTLYDKVLTQWKLWQTIVHPGFHIQNAVSNAFQSFLGVGIDALDPKKLKRAHQIITSKDPKQIIKLNGREYTFKELTFLATESGVLDNTFFKQDLTQDIHEFFLYKAGTKVGTTIEGVQRFNLFLSFIDKGYNIFDAVDGVNKFLFDYGALTNIEKDLFKRVIPFYTFMRKNVPMELEQMLEQPKTFKTLERAFNNFEKTVAGDKYKSENERNEWRQEYVQLPGGEYGISDQMPYTQLERVFEPRKLLGQTTPLIKTPIEAATGEYVYTGVPIESPLDYLLSQSFYSKMGLMADKKYKKSGDKKESDAYVLGQLLGHPINKM